MTFWKSIDWLSLGRELHELRKRLHLTMRDLEDIIEVTPTKICRVEQGKSCNEIDYKKICLWLQCSMDKFKKEIA